MLNYALNEKIYDNISGNNACLNINPMIKPFGIMLISGAEFFQPVLAVFIFSLKRDVPIPLHKLAVIAVYIYYHYIVELHFISIIISRVLPTLYLSTKSADHRNTTPNANVIMFLRGIYSPREILFRS